MDYIERNMQDSINVILNDIDVANQENTNVENDITMLQTKYEKQKFELERLENRLSTLQNVRWGKLENLKYYCGETFCLHFSFLFYGLVMVLGVSKVLYIV